SVKLWVTAPAATFPLSPVHQTGITIINVKLVFRFSSGIFFGFGRGCAGRVCFIGFGVCRT
ncbi:hypothetical protein, partial [Bifidobacterium pullorum]|uniref:hypothetical protein n=1 Tax=Bifidobacterium pullorum TaxID=78448 RepID=UPI00307C5FCA